MVSIPFLRVSFAISACFLIAFYMLPLASPSAHAEALLDACCEALCPETVEASCQKSEGSLSMKVRNLVAWTLQSFRFIAPVLPSSLSKQTASLSLLARFLWAPFWCYCELIRVICHLSQVIDLNASAHVYAS